MVARFACSHAPVSVLLAHRYPLSCWPSRKWKCLFGPYSVSEWGRVATLVRLPAWPVSPESRIEGNKAARDNIAEIPAIRLALRVLPGIALRISNLSQLSLESHREPRHTTAQARGPRALVTVEGFARCRPKSQAPRAFLGRSARAPRRCATPDRRTPR